MQLLSRVGKSVFDSYVGIKVQNLRRCVGPQTITRLKRIHTFPKMSSYYSLNFGDNLPHLIFIHHFVFRGRSITRCSYNFAKNIINLADMKNC